MSNVIKTKRNIKPNFELEYDTKNMASQPYIQKIYPNESGPFAGDSGMQNVASFDFSSPNAMIDFFESDLQGDVLLNSGTNFALDGTAHSYPVRMRLMQQNGEVWEDVPNYNAKTAAEIVITSGAERAATRWSSLHDNANIAVASRTILSSTAIKFKIKPQLSFFKDVKVAHLPVCGNLRLEIYWETSPGVNVLSSSPGTYKIQNLVFNAKMYPMTLDYINRLKAKAKKGELIYNFENVYLQNVPWSQTSNSLSINYKLTSANAFLGQFYISTELNTNGKVDIQKSVYTTPTAVQIQVGTEFYPRQALASPEELLHALQDTFNVLDDVNSSSLITRANYTCANADATIAATPLFYIGINLKAGDSINTGVDLNNSPLIFKTTDAGVSNCYIRYWLYHACIVKVIDERTAVVSV